MWLWDVRGCSHRGQNIVHSLIFSPCAEIILLISINRVQNRPRSCNYFPTHAKWQTTARVRVGTAVRLHKDINEDGELCCVFMSKYIKYLLSHQHRGSHYSSNFFSFFYTLIMNISAFVVYSCFYFILRVRMANYCKN